MGRKSKQKMPSIENAQAAKILQHAKSSEQAPNPDTGTTSHTALLEDPLACDSDFESICQWDGGVNYVPSDSELSQSNSDWTTDSSSETDEFSELEGDELRESLETQLQEEIEMLSVPSPYEQVLGPHTSVDWKRAEHNRNLGYNKMLDCSGKGENRFCLTKKVRIQSDCVNEINTHHAAVKAPV